MENKNVKFSALDIRRFKRNHDHFYSDKRVVEVLDKIKNDVKYNYNTVLRFYSMDENDFISELCLRIQKRFDAVINSDKDIQHILRLQAMQLMSTMLHHYEKQDVEFVYFSEMTDDESNSIELPDNNNREDDTSDYAKLIEGLSDEPMKTESGKMVNFYDKDGKRITYKSFAKSILESGDSITKAREQWHNKVSTIMPFASFSRLKDNLTNHIKEKGLSLE